MFETYFVPILIFAVLGLLAGVLLTAASKIFYVKTDERIEQISDALPQANCGACGFAGCSDYANAIVEKDAATNLCKPGGTEVSAKISEILGTARFAQICCGVFFNDCICIVRAACKAACSAVCLRKSV